MIRWAVDVGGIDVEADVAREKKKFPYTEPSAEGLRLVAAEERAAHDDDPELGEVHVLRPDELLDMYEDRLCQARQCTTMFDTNALDSSIGRSVLPRTRMGSITLEQSGSTLGGSMDFEQSNRGREVRVFCTFISQQGKRTATTVTLNPLMTKGIDVVNAFLQQAISSDERLAQRFSMNPRHYKLFIADEFTGEEEMAVMLDSNAANFGCLALQPLPPAKLYLFPQLTELLPAPTGDINLAVLIRPTDPQSKPVTRYCTTPNDLLIEGLERLIISNLPSSSIIQGSMRIKYGPLELNINEYYNFGAGSGVANCPIADRTLLSLYRFGVTEVVVNGRTVEDLSGIAEAVSTEEITIDMDTEEALAFQQFEVICINRYGARQQRLLCVDGEHLYTMRPNDSESMPKTTERSIKDIEEVKVFPNNPKYIEIVYSKTSHFEEDHIECTTAYNCALLDEKIRILRREIRKREEEAKMAEEEDKNTKMSRFMRWFRN